MKRFFAFVTSIIFVFSGCTIPNSGAGTASTQIQATGKVKVVTSFYPLYEIAKQVGGDYVDVKNLVPPGAEPHDYEITPKDIAGVYESQILVVNGAGLEPWYSRVLPDLQQQTKVRVVDESKLFSDLITGFHEEGGSNQPMNAPQQSYDPHLWMDPVHYAQEVDSFGKIIAEVDPAHKDYYLVQAQQFVAKLDDLDRQYISGLQNCSLHEFVTNHAAFGYLSRRYGITMIAIAGLSPDAEPSPKTISDLITLIKQKNIMYILTESLVSPKIADTIAKEIGAQTLVMNPLEGLTDQEIAQGKNYISVMQENLKNLQTAMNCR